MNISIKYIEHNNIDIEKWDACVQSSKSDLIYANSYFLNAMHPGWDALIINDYESVFPVTKARKFGIKYLTQPYFTQQLGLIGKHESFYDAVDLCLSELQKRYKYIECNLNYLNKTEAFKTSCTKQISILLNLNKTYSELSLKYSKNLIRNLTKANNNGLNYISDVKPDQIVDLFRSNKGKDLHHITSHHYSRLLLGLNKMLEKDVVKISGVEDKENKLIAAAAFAQYKNKRYFFFSALSEFGKDLNAMPFLVNDFIKKHSNQDLLLDFTGSNLESLARFYKSFGAREYVYLRLKLNHLPWPLNLVKK